MPSGDPELSIIVPAYNESAAIIGTLDAIRGFLQRRVTEWEIIVCADGNDGTRQRAAHWAGSDPRIHLLGSAQRRGKGRAVREGVHHARGRIVGFLDADYKTSIEEVDKILPWFSQGYDLVIGSRRVGESRIEQKARLHRRVGSRLFRYAMRELTDLRGIRDTQCGFKFFTAPAAREVFARQTVDGYMFDVEILRLAQALGYRIKEVGVRWRDDGDSRLELFAGNWRNLRDLVKIGRNATRYERARGGTD